ncbi:hypothetical protein [Pseudomonas frederiksbergensis]|uniref:hypothetical protein n=1 Tax=Pseudomonas frederiksbergensis TaxID=104087 RepID=UPI000F4769F6|nr:hypothetical protein [Pseudomonas frederiksbergensis]RON42943.1 hypothetical protein BK667_30540 [Pseudomonas frederiksbergensis]
MEQRIAVARCHEIHLSIRDKEVPRFESIPLIGMAVQLALHIRGLPLVEYERLKLVASTALGIPRIAVDRIIDLLAKIEFIKIQSEGKRIKAILPVIPYYDELYDGIGEYMKDESEVDEFEALTLEIMDKLAGAPHNIDALAGKLGADRKAFDASIELGEKGQFLLVRRHRSKTILLNPTYFSENADVFADHVAKCGAGTIKRTLELIQSAQGWPLSLIIKTGEISGKKISSDDIQLLKRLAQDGMIKPPTITTTHSGESAFIFTPTPGFMNINPLRRDQYERALAIVSAVRQGQLLPNKFQIRNPGALLYRLKTDLQLKPTSDYAEQYQNLVHLRIAQLVPTQGGYTQLKIIDTPENRESLNIAYNLVQGSLPPDIRVDKDAHRAMTGPQDYLESLVSSKNMREREKIILSGESEFEVSQLLLGF